MKVSIRRALCDHLDERSLDATRLRALTEMQAQRSAVRPARLAGYRTRIAFAAVLAFAVVLPFLWLGTPDGENSLVDEIAAEVVVNHLHLKPLEVSTERIAGLGDYFDQLDFVPIASRYVARQGLVLLGGRYCSLRGVTAAQLRLSSGRAGKLHTLYQVGYDPRKFRRLPNLDKGEEPVSTWANGIKVTLWVEKGVLLALTEESGDGEVER